jgi:hypothetical protein
LDGPKIRSAATTINAISPKPSRSNIVPRLL